MKTPKIPKKKFKISLPVVPKSKRRKWEKIFEAALNKHYRHFMLDVHRVNIP